MNHREELYKKCFSHHTKTLYGEICLDDIHHSFKFWEYYLGEYLPEDKNAVILDLGSENGGFVYWLHHKGYRNSYGVEISKEQIEIAGKLDIKNINEFDIIFARDILEHFKKEEIMEILKNIYAPLKKEGKFVIYTINAESPFLGKHRYGDFTHEISFTRTSLSQTLKETGFKEILFKSARPVPYGLKSYMRYVSWKLIENIFKLFILIEVGASQGIFTQNIIVYAGE